MEPEIFINACDIRSGIAGIWQNKIAGGCNEKYKYYREPEGKERNDQK